MLTLRKNVVTLFVDRSSHSGLFWTRGQFWIVPSVENPSDQRQPVLTATEETCALEPVPGHYKYMLGLPF